MEKSRQGEIALKVLEYLVFRSNVRLDMHTRRWVIELANRLGIPESDAMAFATELVSEAASRLFLSAEETSSSAGNEPHVAWDPHAVADALAGFEQDVEVQRTIREDWKRRGGTYVPAVAAKKVRRKLMDGVLAASRLTKREFLAKVQVDRTTWDRWGAMSSIPRKSQLRSIRVALLGSE